MSEITFLMDQSIDPCTDFHKYACGGYIESTSIPDGYNEWNRYTQNYEEILLIIKNLLENPDTKYEGEAERQAKIYYDSCIDTANTREQLQGNPLIDQLELYGGWDVINADNKPSPFIDESSGFKQIIFPDRGFANDPELFSVDLNIDPKNSSRYLLTISVGKLTLPNKDIYEVNATLKNQVLYDAYLKYMTNVGKLLISNSQDVSKECDLQEKEINVSCNDINGDLQSEEGQQKQIDDQLKEVMSNVLEFESDMAKITPPLKTLYTFEESRYVVMSLKELDEKFDFVEGMVDLIKVAYKERLTNLDWMDDLTKIKSVDKVDSLKVKIGYPEYVVDPVKLDQDYQGLDMQKDTFFKNFFSQKRVKEVNEFKRVFKPVDKERWFLPPHTVNAYYDPSKNEIVFLAGILRKPYYDKAYPDAYLFGAIGSIIAHEITHGFDDNGRQYDKDGNVNLWWTNKSIESFVEKTNCYKDQYSDYSIDDHKLNGQLALGDNIADNGGVAISLQALKNYPTKNKIATSSISSMTDDQLFYLAYAQAYCSIETPEALYLQIKTDFHSPNKYRIIGVVSNLKEFSEAYNCPANSNMNPIKKCTLW
ncbi:endothelin-converting enzyme 1-like [Gordionus sp. m RMFG-2023]|uniref:endothelin-converting enzyme 1-like n=1 Tax=Gordionus sp. m RMFG-2023 TaxID=3053472 RepID=UPI0031FDCF53